MRSKSFPDRSRPHRASRNSLDPFPSPASLPGGANERFASGVNTTQCDSDSGDAAAGVEIVLETFDERDEPDEKRHCLGTSGGEGFNLDACIVCDISDEGVSHCSGTDCFVWFHWECLDPELSSEEDLAKTYCPYCWYKVLVMRHESAREKGVAAEKEVSKYLSKEARSKDDSVDRTYVMRDQGEKGVCSSEKEQLQVGKDLDESREEDMPLTEETDYQPQEDKEKFQDAEEDEDEETGGGGKGDVSPVSSGKDQDQIQQIDKPRTRRRLVLKDIDSDISSNESSNEGNEEDVSEQMTSSAQGVTSPSGRMKNQQRKHSTTNEMAKSKTVRDISALKSDQRKRLFWTPEEEEMLKVGVEKFSAETKKNMPWRKILEMGEEVFHETRTPGDLKDKWRNINGGSRRKTY